MSNENDELAAVPEASQSGEPYSIHKPIEILLETHQEKAIGSSEDRAWLADKIVAATVEALGVAALATHLATGPQSAAKSALETIEAQASALRELRAECEKIATSRDRLGRFALEATTLLKLNNDAPDNLTEESAPEYFLEQIRKRVAETPQVREAPNTGRLRHLLQSAEEFNLDVESNENGSTIWHLRATDDFLASRGLKTGQTSRVTIEWRGESVRVGGSSELLIAPLRNLLRAAGFKISH